MTRNRFRFLVLAVLTIIMFCVGYCFDIFAVHTGLRILVVGTLAYLFVKYKPDNKAADYFGFEE